MRQVHPVWINLEYLSAEVWIESCHGLPSQRPDGLVKHFYFPGFTPATGGLLRARPVRRTRRAAGFARTTGVRAARAGRAAARCRAGDGARLVSLFCYPDAPSTHWPRPWPPIRARPCCWRPKAWRPAWKRPAPPGRPALVRLPFVSQPDFDRLLWCADLNFVRGEDSFVRAAWAARPLVWQIYPQHDQVHLDKLEAWLARYPATEGARALIRAWNQPDSPKPLVRPWPPPWRPRPGRPGPAAVTGTQPRPTGPTWRKIWPRFAQSWPRNARIESFLRSPDAIGPQNTDASGVCTRSKTRVKSRIRPPDDGDGGPGSTRR